MKKSHALLFTTVLLSGCSTTNPFTRESKISYAAIGSTVCGGAGALIGALAGQSVGTTLIGGASGAALCGGIGYYLDRQEAELRKKLESTGVRVIRKGESIHLVMPGNILFDSGSDTLHQGFYPVLDSIQLVLNEYDKTGIFVTGHTDSVGTANYNRALSKRRADAVANYLVFKGIAKNRILSQGLGEEFPIADNSTPAGRRTNRRVEIIIRKR